ncbi:MAG: 30S ribosomal protein S7 [Candidatus Liptonbacteria bacterium]|nr:30S ribosomal protein S7 [Candidatus Liptonbacteria bacterium]
MRRNRAPKRARAGDAHYENVAVGRFINYVMKGGKKSVAEAIVYKAFDEIRTKTNGEPLETFEHAIANATPLVEVMSRRVGGANYQVPREVRPERKFMLACRWILEAARGKKGAPMHTKLAEELLAAANNEGAAIKKKQDVHRMAEANRAFAHFIR